jgi:hypothetical protein
MLSFQGFALMQLCIIEIIIMKLKLNLLLALLITTVIGAQNSKNMKTTNDSITKGQIITNGKLVYSEIVINASPERVWKEFTDFESYASWNPFIKSLKGIPVVGGKIEVLLAPPGKKGMTFKPEVLAFDSAKQLSWIGKLLIKGLFDGEHTFILKDSKDGTTTFIQFERFIGILVPLMKKMLDENTLNGFNQMNEALKIRCEK